MSDIFSDIVRYGYIWEISLEKKYVCKKQIKAHSVFNDVSIQIILKLRSHHSNEIFTQES